VGWGVSYSGAAVLAGAPGAAPAAEPWTPVLAIGSNAGPEQLARKFPPEMFPAGVVVPAVRAVLEDFDVVYAPLISSYGSCTGAARAARPPRVPCHRPVTLHVCSTSCCRLPLPALLCSAWQCRVGAAAMRPCTASCGGMRMSPRPAPPKRAARARRGSYAGACAGHRGGASI